MVAILDLLRKVWRGEAECQETNPSSRPDRGIRARARPAHGSSPIRRISAAMRGSSRSGSSAESPLQKEQVALVLLEGPVERRERAVALAEPRENIGQPGLGAAHGPRKRCTGESELGLPVTLGAAGLVGLQEPIGKLGPEGGLVLDGLGEASQPFLDARLHDPCEEEARIDLE